jgi:hypothetical protein
MGEKSKFDTNSPDPVLFQNVYERNGLAAKITSVHKRIRKVPEEYWITQFTSSNNTAFSKFAMNQ